MRPIDGWGVSLVFNRVDAGFKSLLNETTVGSFVFSPYDQPLKFDETQ